MQLNILKYPLHTIIHPLDGFEDIKKPKYKPLFSSVLILVLFFLANNIKTLLTGFQLNSSDPENFNVLVSFVSSVGVVLLFVLCNWLCTSMFNGKGRLKDVFNATAFSILPYVFGMLAYTLLSNFIIIEEAAFADWILFASVIWSGFLLIAGLCEIHEYSIFKTVISIIVSVCGIAILLFLAVLVFSLIMQIEYLFSSIIGEIMIR